MLHYVISIYFFKYIIHVYIFCPQFFCIPFPLIYVILIWKASACDRVLNFFLFALFFSFFLFCTIQFSFSTTNLCGQSCTTSAIFSFPTVTWPKLIQMKGVFPTISHWSAEELESLILYFAVVWAVFERRLLHGMIAYVNFTKYHEDLLSN